MRGTKAKRLRRAAYGDHSLREKRKYQTLTDGSVRVLGRRSLYQAMK